MRKLVLGQWPIRLVTDQNSLNSKGSKNYLLTNTESAKVYALNETWNFCSGHLQQN
jgi:hypothetical protein